MRLTEKRAVVGLTLLYWFLLLTLAGAGGLVTTPAFVVTSVIVAVLAPLTVGGIRKGRAARP